MTDCTHHWTVTSPCPFCQQVEIEQLRAVLERERMRLVACGVAAMQNTRESAKQRIPRDNEYWSASYDDVCRTVDKQMDEREHAERAEADLAAARADAERWFNLLRGYKKAVNAVAPYFDKSLTDENIVHWINLNNVGATVNAAINAALAKE